MSLFMRPRSDHCLSLSLAESLKSAVSLLKLFLKVIKVFTWICQNNYIYFSPFPFLELVVKNISFATCGFVLDISLLCGNSPSHLVLRVVAILCGDETEVWTKVVDWVQGLNQVLNAWVTCAFGTVSFTVVATFWQNVVGALPPPTTKSLVVYGSILKDDDYILKSNGNFFHHCVRIFKQTEVLSQIVNLK